MTSFHLPSADTLRSKEDVARLASQLIRAVESNSRDWTEQQREDCAYMIRQVLMMLGVDVL